MKKLLMLVLSAAVLASLHSAAWEKPKICGWDLGENLEMIWFHSEECADKACDCPACQNYNLKENNGPGRPDISAADGEIVVIDAAPYLVKIDGSGYTMTPVRLSVE